MTTVRIVAAVVDTRNLTLYKEDGSTILIPQGDPRLRRILDEATPQLIAQKWADVVLDAPVDNSYVQFEEQSNGMVKLFRIAKEKLRKLLDLGLVEQEPFDTVQTTDVVAPTAIGAVPGAVPGSVAKTMNVVDEIIAHAVPVSSPDFHERSVAEQAPIEENGHTPGAHTSDDAPDTIVAVIDGKVIPGVEKIKNQFTRAAKLGSTTGVENFLKRIGSVIEQRSHSIEDLLKFMERGDLPIAEDGSIVIYKILRRSGKTNDGDGGGQRTEYVDCHTRKVPQWVGAYVCMDEKLVDHNRNNECSNGLHVARRGYINNFSGDVCVMAKLAPEDVIAVPTYDANKMRVCGYHIIRELTAEQYGLLKANKPITSTEDGQMALAEALAGKHIRRTHEVRITEQQGGGVNIKKLDTREAPKPVVKEDAPEMVEALESGEKEAIAAPVVPTDVVKQVEKMSRGEQAKKLYADWANGVEGAEAALRTFKKEAKVSWEKLGIPLGPDGGPKVPKVKKSRPMPEEGKPIAYDPKPKADSIGIHNQAQSKLTDPSINEGSPRERIQKLLAIGDLSASMAQRIYDIKKASKKSWDTLGVAQVTVDAILKLLGI